MTKRDFMAKTNFSKVENFLDEGMRRMALNKLLDEADQVSGKKKNKKPESALNAEQKELIRILDIGLKRLREVDPKIYTKIKVRRITLDRMLKNPTSLQEIDWKHLKSLKKKIESSLKERFPEKSNEDIISNEQLRHKKKRFNVNEKWLPLK